LFIPLPIQAGIVDHIVQTNTRNSRTPLTRERAQKYYNLTKKYSDKYNVPYSLVLAIQWQESDWVNIKSNVDHTTAGIMQVSTRTYRGLNGYSVSQMYLIRNYNKNIEAGVKYLRQLKNELGRWELAVIAYNYGIGNVRRIQYRYGYKYKAVFKNSPNVVQSYVSEVMERQKIIKEIKDE
jgi:soluble lytic murein transglycosylase-like protein